MLQLRETSIDDTEVVADIIYRSYSVMMAPSYSPETLQAVLSAITKPNPTLLSSGKYFLVRDNEQGVGCGGWSEEVPGRGETIAGLAHIRHFAVTPEAVGKGVGRLIFRRCFQEAGDAGFNRLQVFSSLNAVSFYEKLGFQSVRSMDVPMMDGVTFPSMVMEQEISGRE